jgi:hypothetical protein
MLLHFDDPFFLLTISACLSPSFANKIIKNELFTAEVKFWSLAHAYKVAFEKFSQPERRIGARDKLVT